MKYNKLLLPLAFLLIVLISLSIFIYNNLNKSCEAIQFRSNVLDGNYDADSWVVLRVDDTHYGFDVYELDVESTIIPIDEFEKPKLITNDNFDNKIWLVVDKINGIEGNSRAIITSKGCLLQETTSVEDGWRFELSENCDKIITFKLSDALNIDTSSSPNPVYKESEVC